MESFINCLAFEDVLEEVKEALADKTSNMKTGIL